MSIFGKLFGKHKENLIPISELRELYSKNSAPESREEILKGLKPYDLLILGEADSNNKVQLRTIEAAPGAMCALAFTSLDALNQYAKPGEGYIGMNSHAVFEMVGKTLGLILISSVDSPKVFSGSELLRIVSGVRSAPAGTQIWVAQPAVTPPGLMTGFQEYLRDASDLEDMYFGIHSVGGAEPNYLLVLAPKHALESTAIERIADDIGRHIGKYGADKPVDISGLTETYHRMVDSGTLVSVRNYSQVAQ